MSDNPDDAADDAEPAERRPRELAASGLECPQCLAPQSRVVDTRPVIGRDRRKRRCARCGYCYRTLEAHEAVFDSLPVVAAREFDTDFADHLLKTKELLKPNERLMVTVYVSTISE